MQNLSLEEQETTIGLVPARVSDRADVYSSDTVMKERIKRLAKRFPDDVLIDKEDEIGLFATVPASWVTIRRPRQMNYSEEQKAALAEHLRNIGMKPRQTEA